jgi:hypothetical protein
MSESAERPLHETGKRSAARIRRHEPGLVVAPEETAGPCLSASGFGNANDRRFGNGHSRCVPRRLECRRRRDDLDGPRSRLSVRRGQKLRYRDLDRRLYHQLRLRLRGRRLTQAIAAHARNKLGLGDPPKMAAREILHPGEA